MNNTLGGIGNWLKGTFGPKVNSPIPQEDTFLNRVQQIIGQGVSNVKGNVQALSKPQTRKTWVKGFTPPSVRMPLPRVNEVRSPVPRPQPTLNLSNILSSFKQTGQALSRQPTREAFVRGFTPRTPMPVRNLMQNVQNIGRFPQMAQGIPSSIEQKATEIGKRYGTVGEIGGRVVGGLERGFTRALTTPFTKKPLLSKATDVLAGIGSTAIAGKSVGLAALSPAFTTVGSLLINKRLPTEDELMESYTEGMKFATEFGPISAVLSPVTTKLLGRFNPKEIKTAVDVIKRLAVKGTSGATVFGGFGYLTSEKQGKEKINEAVDYAIMGALFDVGMEATGLAGKAFLNRTKSIIAAVAKMPPAERRKFLQGGYVNLGEDIGEKKKIKIAQPLVKEAKKYKSAEEFVKARGVQRIEEKGASVSFDKPQGLYTTPSKVKSPHSYLGGKKSEFVIKPEARVLSVSSKGRREGVRGIRGTSAGVLTLEELASKKIINEFSRTSKEGAIQILFRDFPDLKSNKNLKFYDTQDVMEAYAGRLAKSKGYDVIENLTESTFELDKQFEEIVILNKDIVLTKQQLTDIYKQATKGVGKIKGKLGKQGQPLSQQSIRIKQGLPLGKQGIKVSEATKGVSQAESSQQVGGLTSQIGDYTPLKISIADKKYVFNINKERLKLGKKQKAVLDEVVNKIKPELQNVKGKTMSKREVLKAAKESEILSKVTTREETLSANAQVLKARQRLVSLDKDIEQLSRKGQNPKILKKKLTDLVDSLRVVSSEATDRGRKLQSLSVDAGDESVRQEILKRVARASDNTKRISEEAAKVDWNNSNSVFKFYRKFVKPSITNVLDEYRYNNMLSNPRTHMRNAFSNMLQTFFTRPATLLAQGKVKETGQYYKGAFSSLPKAVKAFSESFKGIKPIEKPDISFAPTGKMPKFMTIPTRAMEAGDKFFSAIIEGGELARGATQKQASEVASYSLFRQTVSPKGQGALLNAIDSATKWMYKAPKAVRWFVPFIRTPMNYAKQWVEYSPTGVSTIIGATNKREQLAKTILGSIASVVGGKMALDGRTTWAVPTDSKEKKYFYDEGKIPFAIKIGNKWVSMMYAGPFAMALAIPAAIKYYNNESRTVLTDTQLEKIGKVAMSMGKFLSGQTFMSGLNQFVRLASGDVDYNLGRNLGYTAGQVIPMSALQRYVSTIIDPIYRKSKTFGSEIKKTIPFMSKALEPHTDLTGQPSRRESINYAIPYDVRTEKESRGLLQIRRGELQQNAVINKLKSDLESGKVPSGVQGGVAPDLEISKLMFKYSDEEVTQLGNSVLYKDNGTIKTIDLAFNPKPPELTGNAELDKKLISKYRGKNTSKMNDVVTLYKLGQITEKQAEKQLQRLLAERETVAKGKKKKKAAKITIKRTTPPLMKISPISFKRAKIGRRTFVKQPDLTISKNKSNIKIT